ncbi:MAG: aldehyde dehydrogenase, partial [Firmicutes bacterium]|nr:aldehyde dehydrogenase [Bacillota bacterium]
MDYDREQIQNIVEAQRSFFRSGKTLDLNWRIEQLTKLKQAVIDNQEMLEDALHEDLRRSRTEAFLTD